MRRVEIEPSFESWQAAARALLRDAVPPAEVAWSQGAPSLLPPPRADSSDAVASPIRVPRQFIDLAREVAGHRDPGRWALLYDVLWRLVHEDHDLLKSGTAPQARRLFAMATEVRRRASSPPTGATAAGTRVETEDELTDQAPGAASFIPANAGIAELREAARRCTGCDLYRHATQTVFSRGPADARIVLVGEQPGDQEDLQGAPFVGPAGEVLDRALSEVGLERERLYVTNAVKHFKFVARGKRRIHQTPGPRDIAACRPWIEAELAAITPEILVCLGATASRALIGPDFRLMRDHGRFVPTRWAAKTLATLHPSAVLRGEDEAAQAGLYAMLMGDLGVVAAARPR